MANTLNNSENDNIGIDHEDPSSSGRQAERQDSTTTEANGGTRSSPPRVGGDGRGEAKDVKAKSADKAQSAVTDEDSRPNA